MGVSRDCSIFGYPLLSGTGEATNVKFCMHIHRIITPMVFKPIVNI